MKVESPLGALLDSPGTFERSELRSALVETWRVTMGRELGTLDEDLELCRRWFDPVAQGQRLRRELPQLPPIPEETIDPGPPWTLVVGPSRRLVTPEGRCAIDVLQRGGEAEAPTEDVLLPYDRRLAHLYRIWSRHRIETVVDLLSGADKPLQIPAAGVVIALMVNRCTSESRALTRFAAGSSKDVVDRAFFAPVHAFADILAPSGRRNRTDPQLVSGWMLYEARRRLGDGLAVIDSRGGKDGKVWVVESECDQVEDRIARDLVRGHRKHATPDRFGLAFDALVEQLREQLPSLAGFGLVHERPRDTARLRERLMGRLSWHLGASGDQVDSAS